MEKTILTWRSVLKYTKNLYPEYSPESYKFKRILLDNAEKLGLSGDEAQKLALNLGFKLYPKPAGIPGNWTSVFCKHFVAQKYINPEDPKEYVVIKPPEYRGGIPYVIHRTPQGFSDERWFLKVLPELENIIGDLKTMQPFSGKFNERVNQLFGQKGMAPGQVEALTLFFEKYVPGLQLCTTCFKVTLPRYGAGERWVYRKNEIYEIRLSAAKPNGLPGQTVEYVTQTALDSQMNIIYAMWDADQSKPAYTPILKQEATHIPWSLWDRDKFSVGLPPCTCKR